MKTPKYYYGWNIVAASIFGFSASPGQFAFAALGFFMIPLGVEFGWDRTEISLAVTIFTITQAFATAIIGRIVDKHGAKEVLIPSIILFGLLLAAIPLLTTKLWHLYLIFFLIGGLAAGSAAVPYLRIIGAWFKKNRGFAFGITMAGGGVGFMYVPPMLQYLIENYGWRSGYYALSAIVLFISLPLVFMVLRNTPQEIGLAPDGVTDNENMRERPESILTLGRVLNDKVFWVLYIFVALLTFCLYGLMLHLKPMLMDRGMDDLAASFVFSSLGTTVVIARVGTGFLLDRFFAPKLAMIFILISTVGVAILSTGAIGTLAFIAAILIGFSIGAELDLLAYLTTRYFGLGSFGMIYGLLFSGFLLGVSTGPLAFGAAFETYGSYVNMLFLAVIVLISTAGMMLLLPKYRD